MKLRYAFIVVAIMLFSEISVSPALAEYEDVEPQAVGSPDQWQTSGGLNKVLLVTDASDFTYIYEDSAGHIQDFSLTDPTSIDAGDTIDSVKVVWRGQDSGAGSNQARVNLYLTGNTSNGSTIALTTSWTEYTESFSDKPGGSGWTIDDINGLEVQTECVSVAKNREVRCSKIYVRVYYSLPAEKSSPRRIKINKDFGG